MDRGSARGTMCPSEYSTLLCAMMRRFVRDNAVVHDLWLAACILHPFLKVLQCVSVLKRESYKKRGKDKVRKMYMQMGGEVENRHQDGESDQSLNGNTESAFSRDNINRKRKFDTIQFADSHFPVRFNGSSDELTKYLGMDVLQFSLDKNAFMEDNFDALSFWSRNRGEFPVLFKVACRVLATPVSSCTSERVFSAVKKCHLC